MGIRIDGTSDLINAADGSLTVEGLSINVSGVVTASGGFKSSGDITVGVSTFFVDKSATNVGVGTNVPYNNAGTNVHIHSANTTSEIRFTNSTTGGGNNGGTIQQGGNNLYVSNSEAGYIAFENNGSERLRITSSGSGISTNARDASSYGSPQLLISGNDSTLTLMGDGSTNASSYTGIKFRVAGASTGDYTKAGIFAKREGGYNDLAMIFAMDTAADATSVATSDETMRLYSDGCIGLGTCGTDSRKDGHLQVETTTGGRYAASFANHHASTGKGVRIQATDSDESNWILLCENRDGTNRFGVKGTGNVEVHDGNLVIGTSGHGIDFSAMSDTEGGAGSATSEVLDDYEFGTWTPAYQSTGGTYGYATQEGWYCKVGKFVTVRAYIATDSVSASSHNLVKVTGLPFQVAYRTPGSIRCNGFQSSGTLEGFPSAWSFEHNQTHGELQRFNANGNTDFTSSTFNSTTHVYLAGTYKID